MIITEEFHSIHGVFKELCKETGTCDTRTRTPPLGYTRPNGERLRFRGTKSVKIHLPAQLLHYRGVSLTSIATENCSKLSRRTPCF